MPKMPYGSTNYQEINQTALTSLQYILHNEQYTEHDHTGGTSPVVEIPDFGNPVAFVSNPRESDSKRKLGISFYIADNLLHVIVPGFGPGGSSVSVVNFLALGSWRGLDQISAGIVSSYEPYLVMELRNLLLSHPQLNTIRVLNDGVMSMIGHSFAYLVLHLIARTLPNPDQDVTDFCSNFYKANDSTMETVVTLVQSGDTSNAFVRALNLPTTATPSEIVTAVAKVDQEIFSKVCIDAVYSLGSSAGYTYSAASKYNKVLGPITYSYG
jgi:hypothetical protein